MTDINAKLFDEFSEWITKRDTLYSKNKNDTKKYLSSVWYKPGEEAISVLDNNNLQNLFKRDDIQEFYEDILKNGGTFCDSTIAKWQTALIAADERAFRMRHLTTPRALAHGRSVILRWSESHLSDQIIKQINNSITVNKKYNLFRNSGN